MYSKFCTFQFTSCMVTTCILQQFYIIHRHLRWQSRDIVGLIESAWVIRYDYYLLRLPFGCNISFIIATIFIISDLILYICSFNSIKYLFNFLDTQLLYIFSQCHQNLKLPKLSPSLQSIVLLWLRLWYSKLYCLCYSIILCHTIWVYQSLLFCLSPH